MLRILPRVNDDVNEEWLADKSRYVVDGLKRQRLDRPYVRVDGKLRPATWSEALDAVAAKLKGAQGGRNQREAPIHASNVAFHDAASGKGVRLGVKVEGGTRQRVQRPSGKPVEAA